MNGVWGKSALRTRNGRLYGVAIEGEENEKKKKEKKKDDLPSRQHVSGFMIVP